MACFTAPAAVAIVTTVFRKRIPEKYHINWLNALLWGEVRAWHWNTSPTRRSCPIVPTLRPWKARKTPP